MVQYLITFYMFLHVNLVVKEQNLIICELFGHDPLETDQNFKKMKVTHFMTSILGKAKKELIGNF